MVELVETPLDADTASHRIWRLRELHAATLGDRTRMRAVMDGGREGIVALLGEKAAKNQDLIPAANMILSAGSKLAHKIGRVPTLKVAPPEDSDSQRQADRAQLVEQVIRTQDRWVRLPLHMPQIGRWLPGYGFYVHVIRERLDRDGNPYPAAQLRDPYDCYPGSWGVDQVPHELGVLRRADPTELVHRYPALKAHMTENHIASGRTTHRGTGVVGGATPFSSPSWSTIAGEGVLVGELYTDDGWWLCAPEVGVILDYLPNVAPGVPQFIVGKRFAFNRLTSQFVHAFGLQAAQARLTMWSIVAMQDAVFSETNVYGDLPRGQRYRKGRDAVNIFSQGTRVERPNQNLPYQMFQQIDRVERLLRNTVSYPVTDDAESPVGYATGAAVNELQSAVTGEVGEYHLSIADGLQRLDAARLAWDEVRFGGRYRKRLYKRMRTYDPASIQEMYDTERVFGVMAGWDEPRKIVSGLQLLQAEALDTETFANQLDGVDDWKKIDRRNKARAAEKALLAILEQDALQGNPEARLALLELMPEGDTRKALEKFYTPKGEEPDPEELAMMAQASGGAMPPGLGPEPPDVQTVLTQLGIDGGIKGGSQVVARV